MECAICCDVFTRETIKVFSCLHLVCSQCYEETLTCLWCENVDLVNIDGRDDSSNATDNTDLTAINSQLSEVDELKTQLHSRLEDLLRQLPAKSKEITEIMHSKIKSLNLYQDELKMLQDRLREIRPMDSTWIKGRLQRHHDVKDDLRVHKDVIYHERDYSIRSERPSIKFDKPIYNFKQIDENHLLVRNFAFEATVMNSTVINLDGVIKYTGKYDLIKKDDQGNFVADDESTELRDKFLSKNFDEDDVMYVNGIPIFFLTDDDYFYRVTEDRQKIWKIEENYWISSPIIYEDEVLIRQDNKVLVYSLTTGKFLSSFHMPLPGSIKIAPYSGHIVVSNQNRLSVVGRDGSIIADMRLPSSIKSFEPLTTGEIAVFRDEKIEFV